MPSVPVWAAFGAGLLSLISPCVLPLLPAYVGFLSGMGGMQEGEQGSRLSLLRPALLFVLGFSLVFVALGASASAVGQLLLRHQQWVQRVAGAVVILFGLQTLGVIRLPILDRGFQWGAGRGGRKDESGSPRVWQAFLVGMAFGGGWAPCIGPILGSILLLAATGDTLMYGVILLAAYAAGLGVPFLAFALFMDRMEGVLRFFRTHHQAVRIASGLMLLVLGVMLYTNAFTRLAQYGSFFYRWFDVW